MINKKEKNKILIVVGSVLIVLLVCLIQLDFQEAVFTNARIQENKIIGWGIKRANNNMQPDVGENNKKLLEENEGICLGKDTEKVIYLTFDEGYEAGYTEKILNTLKENDTKATFFITAHYLNTASDLVERMISEGHIVGNHTVNHKSMPSISNDEIEKEIMKLHQAVMEKFNYEMKYMRPPKGEFNERTLKKTSELGYKTVMWSFAYFDWDEKKQPSLEESKKMIINNLHCGEIMLLHPNSKTNSEVLDTIIKEAKEQGYEFKLLDEFQ
mgnify:FL=1